MVLRAMASAGYVYQQAMELLKPQRAASAKLRKGNMTMKSIQRYSPLMMELTAYIHSALGLILAWGTIRTIGSEGFVNTIAGQHDREAAFWFLFAGAMMWLLARFMRWTVVQQRQPLPASLGWHLITISAVGAIMMPISGFWLVLAQGIIMVWNRR